MSGARHVGPVSLKQTWITARLRLNQFAHPLAETGEMKRPPQQTVPDLSPAALATLAARADYKGSVEHKDVRTWLGYPQPRRRGRHEEPTDRRQNATICPLATNADREMAAAWLRNAIRCGQFDRSVWDGEFPRYVWYKDEKGQYWLGRCMQRGSGGYKGWPIQE